MDFKGLVDSFSQVAAVLSVELKGENEYGAVRLVEANDLYIASVRERGCEFVPGELYTSVIERDMTFEGMCYQCVRKNQPVHLYVEIEMLHSWLSNFVLPLHSDQEGIGYCLFTYEMMPQLDPSMLANSSAGMAEHVLKTCIRLREIPDFEEAMQDVIEDIRELCAATHCCILTVDEERESCAILCEAVKKESGHAPLKELIRPEFYNVVKTWPKAIEGDNSCVVLSEHDMRELEQLTPEWAATLRRDGVRSVVLYELKNNKRRYGYIWALDFEITRADMIKQILGTTTFILSAEIASHQMYHDMEEMSRTDLLTGVLNRNAMNNRIDNCDNDVLLQRGSFGVVFADVNGLKIMNDTYGHVAGDELLKKAAGVLIETFRGQEIYRAGGDEFVVLTQRIEEAEFEACLDRLREQTDLFSVGGLYSNKGGDVRRMMQIADERMYEAKEAYYRAHPEIPRR
ncbi:MAG: GGDEF domain-containing protein [Lachnospiraceae bacterium]|nr:GGDEF domain-containing protein [Lachnospiraceae bacterium]